MAEVCLYEIVPNPILEPLCRNILSQTSALHTCFYILGDYQTDKHKL